MINCGGLIDVRAAQADAGQSGDPEGAPGQQCAAPAAVAPPHCAHQYRLPEYGQCFGNSIHY